MAGSMAQVVGLKDQAVGLDVPAVNLSVQVIGPEAGIVGLRGRAIRLGIPEVGLRGLGDGPRVKVVNVGRVNRVHLYFFVDVAVRKSYISSVINNCDYFSFLTVSSLVLDVLVRCYVPYLFIVYLVACGGMVFIIVFARCFR